MKYKALIDQMTLEEKASLMSGKDFWETQDIPRLHIPSIVLSDGPHGIRKQEGQADHLGINASVPATCFPPAATVCNSWDEVLAEKIGEALGKEASKLNVSVLLGPGCNMKRNPRCGRNFEYFSEDPYLAGKFAASYIRGIQSQGVAACVKHFAANNQEERRMAIDTIIDERTLREIYLTAFEIAVKEGKTKTIMSAYNKVNGYYANENPHLLKDILRNEWGFDGVIVTDWGGENDRVDGIKCSNELQMPSDLGDSDLEIINAIKAGALKESELDQCVDRLLDLIFETSRKKNTEVDYDEHHMLAQKAAEKSIVLLKNEDNILPLKSREKVAIIGDFAKKQRYQGAGSSVVMPTKLDETLEVINKFDLDCIGYEQGFDRFGKPDKKMLESATNLAKQADVVLLYIGLDEIKEEEGVDRRDIQLSKNQIDVLDAIYAVNKNIVIVLACGAVVEMNFENKAKAIVHGYLGGQAGAKAILNILTGKVNPSGKLAETYPYTYNDVSSKNHFPGKEVSVEYREGLYIGYRYYDTARIPVRYPFGYGLSYTTFEYKGLEITQDSISFEITNTGKVAGEEIAQLYIGTNSKKIFRPKKELKGFSKVFLEVGETKKITITLDDKAFRYFNVKTNKWEVEEGEYTLYIGANCNDTRLKGIIYVKGTTNTVPYDVQKLPSYFSGKVQEVSQEEFENLLGTKVPNPKWDRTQALTYNDTISQMQYAKGLTARLAYHLIMLSYKMFKKMGKYKMVNMYEMLILHLPFRGMCKMSCGAFSREMVDGVLIAVNENVFKGLLHIRKASKKRIECEKYRASKSKK